MTSPDLQRRQAAARVRRTFAFLPALVASGPGQSRAWELAQLQRELERHRLMVEAAKRHLATKEDEIRNALARDWSVREVEAAVVATVGQEPKGAT